VTSSTSRSNIATAQRFLQLVSDHDVEGIIALTAPDWTMHGGPPGLPRGPEGVRRLFATFGQITQQWTVEDVVAEGDRVVLRGTNVCTQEAFLGVPGRGVRQVFTATFVLRIVNGLIAEVWRNADDLGRVLQLGARIVPGGERSLIEARWAERGPVERVADQLVTALEGGDATTLERIYHPDLQFFTHPGGVVDRAGALVAFRQLWPLLRDVRVHVRDRQLTDTGFVSQDLLSATLADGSRLAAPVCMVAGLRDEQIVRVDAYFDPADLAPLMASHEQRCPGSRS
jgi:ketosteroid isomerase-like protein